MRFSHMRLVGRLALPPRDLERQIGEPGEGELPSEPNKRDSVSHTCDSSGACLPQPASRRLDRTRPPSPRKETVKFGKLIQNIVLTLSPQRI